MIAGGVGCPHQGTASAAAGHSSTSPGDNAGRLALNSGRFDGPPWRCGRTTGSSKYNSDIADAARAATHPCAVEQRILHPSRPAPTADPLYSPSDGSACAFEVSGAAASRPPPTPRTGLAVGTASAHGCRASARLALVWAADQQEDCGRYQPIRCRREALLDEPHQKLPSKTRLAVPTAARATSGGLQRPHRGSYGLCG
jgi:hypothetical protein